MKLFSGGYFEHEQDKEAAAMRARINAEGDRRYKVMLDATRKALNDDSSLASRFGTHEFSGEDSKRLNALRRSRGYKPNAPIAY